MDRIFIVLLGALLNSWIAIYICTKLLDAKIDYKNKKYYIYLIGMTVLIGIIYLLTDNFLKTILNFVILTFISINFLKKNLVESMVASFVSLVIVLVAELMYAILLIMVFKVDSTYLHNSIFGSLLSNVIVIMMAFAITKLSFVISFFRNYLVEKVLNKKFEIFIFTVLTIMLISMIVYYIYFEVNIVIVLLSCIAMIVVYLFLLFNLFNEKNNYTKLQIEYEMTLSSLSEYEKLYSYQRMINHEFKNDLMVIRGMTNIRNKKLLRYIDEIANFKNNRDEKWMNTLKRIPQGGLLGILYYKLLSMEQEKINIIFEIGANFSSKKYSLMDEKLKNKLCKLLGIYLDNAIQAVRNLDERNISITIDGKEDEITFSVMNNFKGYIELSKIYNKGYTTNEYGHGYGLAIAKEIFDSEDKITNNTKVTGNIFSQEIKIKM